MLKNRQNGILKNITLSQGKAEKRKQKWIIRPYKKEIIKTTQKTNLNCSILNVDG